MKKILVMLSAMMFAGVAGASYTAEQSMDIVEEVVVEKQLCEYWGPDVEIGESALEQLAEVGLTLIEVGAETVLCGIEGTAYLTYNYGLKPVGKAGLAVLCAVGGTMKKFIEIFVGPLPSDDTCK